MSNIETYMKTINHNNGWYIKIEEYFICGQPVKAKEKHYDPNNRCVYVKEYSADGRTLYEEWRKYWDNNEIRGLYNSEGFKQEFDYRGLPIKE